MTIFSKILLLSLLVVSPSASEAAPKGRTELSVGQLIERLASSKKAARQQAERTLRVLDRTIWDALREASKKASSEGVRKEAARLHAALTEAAIVELLPPRKSGAKPRRWEQVWRGSSLPYLRVFKAQDKTGEVLILDLWSRLRLSAVGAPVLSKLLVQRKVKCAEVAAARDIARDYLAASFGFEPLSGLVIMARREKGRVVVTTQLDDGRRSSRRRGHVEVVVAVTKACMVSEVSRRRLR